MDYLQRARHSIEQAVVSPVEEEAMVNAQLAIACALVALVERLDALIVPMVGGEKALQTFTYTQEAA